MSKESTNKKSTPPKVIPAVEDSVLKLTEPPMSGERVEALHKLLIAAKLAVGNDVVKKIYGRATMQAVRHYQAANDLYVTGCVDEKTAAKLGI